MALYAWTTQPTAGSVITPPPNITAFSVTGTITAGAFSGNASSATKLATARSINGTNFDGTANITTAHWGTARNLTIGKTAKSVNGSGNVAWSQAEILGSSTNAYFYRGDQAWSNTLVNQLIANSFKAGSSVYGPNSIELYYSTPFIDFHFGNSTANYTSRIIEDQSGRLNISDQLYITGNGYVNAGRRIVSGASIGSATKGIYTDGNGYTQPMTYELKATVNVGAANRLAYYSGANAISQASSLYATINSIGINATSIANVTEYMNIANTATTISPHLYVNGYSNFTEALLLPINKRAIIFQHTQSYSSYIYYANAGNEALNFVNRNAVTSFIFWTGNSVNGANQWYLNESGAARTDHPAIQIKQNSLYVNKLLPHNTNAAYNLYVNGPSYLGGTVSVWPDHGNFNEGIRIHANNNWSEVLLCGSDNTGDTGTSAKSWVVANYNGNLYITKDGGQASNSNATRSELMSVDNQWRLRSYAQAHKEGIYRSGLHIAGPTYGNTAADMVSGTAGVFRFGDGGPQITFDSSINPGDGQAAAMIFTDNDTAGTGCSIHFVSNQNNDNQGGDLWVTAPMIKARKSFQVVSAAESWLNGQNNSRKNAINFENFTNTSAYWPMIKGRNTASSYMFSLGQLNTSIYLMASSTSRTENDWDRAVVYDMSNGRLTVSKATVNQQLTLNTTASECSISFKGTGYQWVIGPNAGSPGANNFGFWNSNGGQHCFIRDSGEICLSATNGLRLYNGDYGVIFRRSENNFYIIPTASGQAKDGGISSLRPFTIALASGHVTMGNTAYCPDFRGGKVRLYDNWIGFYANANIGGNRVGYIQCNVDTMYFTKENNNTADNAFRYNGDMKITDGANYLTWGVDKTFIRGRNGDVVTTDRTGTVFDTTTTASNTAVALEAFNQTNNAAIWAHGNAGVWHESGSGSSTGKWLIYINTSGTVTANTSDKRFKIDKGALSDEETNNILSEISIINYIYKEDVEYNNLEQSGIYAQNLRDILLKYEYPNRNLIILNKNEKEKENQIKDIRNQYYKPFLDLKDSIKEKAKAEFEDQINEDFTIEDAEDEYIANHPEISKQLFAQRKVLSKGKQLVNNITQNIDTNSYYDLELSEEDYIYNINYEAFIPYLIKGWQIQQKTISEQNEQIQSLEHRISQLEMLIQNLISGGAV